MFVAPTAPYTVIDREQVDRDNEDLVLAVPYGDFSATVAVEFNHYDGRAEFFLDGALFGSVADYHIDFVNEATQAVLVENLLMKADADLLPEQVAERTAKALREWAMDGGLL